MVADDPVPIWRQDICNHDDVDRSVRLMNYEGSNAGVLVML